MFPDPDKATAYPSEAVYRCFTLGFIAGWKGKHTSCVRTFTEEKSFITLAQDTGPTRRRGKKAQTRRRDEVSPLKTFYRSNLLPFHGHTVILCYKATLPW